MQLRREQGWTQQQLATTLSVSKRTLSNWECGYWLPPFKQRLHVVLALRDVPPEFVLEVADGLGVSVDPAVAPFLQPYRDALVDPDSASGEEPVAAPEPLALPAAIAAPLPPPDPPEAESAQSAARPAPDELRVAVDAIVRDAADGMNVSANELRIALGRALDACTALSATLEDAKAAVAVAAKTAKGPRAGTG